MEFSFLLLVQIAQSDIHAIKDVLLEVNKKDYDIMKANQRLLEALENAIDMDREYRSKGVSWNPFHVGA